MSQRSDLAWERANRDSKAKLFWIPIRSTLPMNEQPLEDRRQESEGPSSSLTANYQLLWAENYILSRDIPHIPHIQRTIIRNNEHLRISYFNIRSLTNSINSYVTKLMNPQRGLILITETWLNSDWPTGNCNWECIRTKNCRHSGTAILYNKTKIYLQEWKSSKCLEEYVIAATAYIGNTALILMVAYCPPDNIEELLQYIT